MADEILKSKLAGAADQAGEAVEAAGRRVEADSRAELDALSEEVNEIKASLQQAARASGRAVQQSAVSVRDDVAEQVRARPLAAVAFAALLGYVYGLSR